MHMISCKKRFEDARVLGGKIIGGERVANLGGADAYYVIAQHLLEMTQHEGPMLHETFAPILYVMPYKILMRRLRYKTAVAAVYLHPIFTLDMREAELFISAQGSDCGMRMSILVLSAEIGGAFGGEKEQAAGVKQVQIAGKAYMRRTTNTLNYGTTLPLAQGVTFDV